jgi:glycosyltransferase 2 family protein
VLPRRILHIPLQFKSFLKAAFSVCLAFFCIQFFIPAWESLRLSQRLETVSITWLLAASAFLILYYLFGLLLWVTILRHLHSNVKIGVAFRAFSLALLPKYIPGKILAHGIRAQLCVNAGVPIATALNSLLIEALFAVGSAAVLSLPLLFIYQSLGSDYLLIWVFGAGTVLLLLFLRSQKNFASLFRDNKPSQKYTTVFAYAQILLDLTLLWFMIGLAHWCVANSFGSYPVWRIPDLIIAVAASWGLGVLAVFTPAGLGVREASLYFLVQPFMDSADALLLATLSRLLMFAVEIILSLIAWLCFSAPSSEPETDLHAAL